MNNLIKINNKDLAVKELEGKRVVTFKDIDNLHERAEGTASRNFRENRDKFINEVDYFEISRSDVGTNFVGTYGFNKKAPNGMLITESGYLMLVKSFTDDLAWKVQRQLVDSYFRGKQLVNRLDNLSPQLQLLINIEMKQKEADEKQRQLEIANNENKQEIEDMRNVIQLDTTSWRKDTAQLISKMAISMGGFEHIKDIRNKSYELLDKRMGVALSIRLTNKRRRMAEEGVSKSKRDKLKFVDIIAEDKKLIEGYVAIVKEMAIKYKIA